VLVGAVAADAGVWAPVSFLIAGAIAVPTALSYGEFASRLPEAAGPALFVRKGLGLPWLGLVVGLTIAASGTISAAAVLRGGTGYLVALTGLPFEMTAIAMGAALVAVAVLGVLESLAFAAVLTAIEVVGLVMVVIAGTAAPPSPDFALPEAVAWSGVTAGAVLAFFAFIGFEDMVNMAEEVRAPERTLPRAILAALAITAVLYGLVSWAAVRAVPLGDLGGSERPLALVWQAAHGGSAWILSLIAVAAALNGVLAQIVMAARVLFGLGRRHPALGGFYHAHPRFGTPVGATLLVGASVIAAALLLPVAALAGLTSTLLLAVFALVNASLVAVKRRAPEAPFRVPLAVPVVGLAAALAALGASLWGGGS